MSYILDALRKADSERERGEVPGLHAHPVVSTGEEPSGTHVNQKLLLAVGLLTALLLLILIWLMWGRGESQPDRPPMPPDQAGMGAPPGAPPQLGGPGGAGMAPVMAQATPTPTPPAPPVPAVPPMTGTPAPGLYPPAMAQLAAADTTAPATPKSTQPAMSAASASNTAPRKATATAAPKATEDTKVYRLMDLPESVRRDLPTLTIGGAMYSDTPANRMLIINSQVLHEGDKITAELTLEEVKLKSAVFRFRTYRYLVSY